MRVLLLTRYGSLGASSRLRAYQYLPYLRAQGFQITAVALFGDYYQEDLVAGRPRRWGKIAAAYLRRCLDVARAGAFDLVWIEYELFPGLPALAERLLSGLRIPYVVDYDDAIHHRYGLHRNPIVRALLGKKIDVVMRKAAVVIVGNDYLAQRAAAVGAKRIEYVPTVVDIDRYAAVLPRKATPLTVGWVGSPGTAGYLSLIKPVLAEVIEGGRARLVLVGARDLPLDGVAADVRPWSEATEAADIREFDVGIMPLPDEPWERGKCGYKLIQYMACALPVIASPVGVNRQIVVDGVNGFLAGTDDEWRTAFRKLAADPDLRMRLGRAGRAQVEAQFSTRVTAPRLAGILGSISGLHSP